MCFSIVTYCGRIQEFVQGQMCVPFEVNLLRFLMYDILPYA